MNDEQLRRCLERLRGGDRSALEEIYSGLKTPIFTVALRITGSRQLSEDVVQEVFVKLFVSPPEASVKKPRAYIFRMAHNMALDIAKKFPPYEELTEESASYTLDSGTRLDIKAALDSLEEQQRRVVTLRVSAGLKFREIAEITGEPLGTVLWRYNKAIAALRRFLDGGTV